MRCLLNEYTPTQDKKKDQSPVSACKTLLLIIVALEDFAKQFGKRAFWIDLRWIFMEYNKCMKKYE